MKTIEIKLFSFNELTKEAQQVAIKNERDNMDSYYLEHEAMQSLNKFAEHFNSELKDWSIDFWNTSRSYVKFSVPEYMEEISENDLKLSVEAMGEYNPKTLKGLGDCKFTGVCFDEDAGDGARKAYFAGERDVNAILQAGFESWLDSVQKDVEYQMSDEAIIETFEANSYDFTEDGEIY